MSADLKETFEKATKLASSPEGGKWSLSTAQKSTMYACFKQVNVGDCTGDRPGMFNPINRQKYDAWKAVEGMSKEDAMNKYIDVVEAFVPDVRS
ncbi:CoA-binding domain-containing protein 5 [Seminavis robusta]|uniref:CoA-binding domain-containing protein 5 n=1 Tax=Seminavis robusta TaxID=568900 RepID=A0A9N8D5N3_9STRA|nr:CoA-binding domain-containing protein 5 [Seminavis robusta]|eukprot:Sro11_g008820.1 CoA-binding domain-containing protein 5 (94) ;mRNA; f:165809-166090